jgi:hypothetical protein
LETRKVPVQAGRNRTRKITEMTGAFRPNMAFTFLRVLMSSVPDKPLLLYYS